MHPRVSRRAWDAETQRRAADVLAFVRERGSVHPREVDQAFAHGRVTNYWGGTCNASTHLLDGMHYRGLLRVQRRDSGTRIYAVADHAEADAIRAAALGQPDLPGAPAGLWCTTSGRADPQGTGAGQAAAGQLHAGRHHLVLAGG
ncbi:hypothetical protein G6F58_012784 [Rhizopus delemar]|nr:hypothetical protein G6F58_012784 [Rhizopus delemar]